MISVFLDETSDAKFKNYFGLCMATINSTFYPVVKREFQKILQKNGWDPCQEFKGSFLFSAKQGDTSVNVEDRVAIAQELISLNKSTVNARMKFYYFSKNSDDHKKDYLSYLPVLLKKALPKAEKKGGKNLVAFHYDQRSDITPGEIRDVILPILNQNSFELYEDVYMTISRFDTVGVLYADIVGYLQARVHTISRDTELFENVPPEHWETNGKLRKLRSSTNILEGIKQFELYQVKE
jgi:hypothetical protein